MAISYSDLLYAAINNALRGTAALQNPAVDAIGIADTLFPVVSQSVSEAAAANEYKRSLLRREKSVTLVAGSATLDDDVLTHYIADATLIDPTSSTTLLKHYAWRDYPDFIRRGDRRIGIFTLKGGTLLQVIDPNVGFTVPLTTTGTYSLTIPCVVIKPATAATNVDCPDEIASDLVEALAEALRGVAAKQAGEAA
jgi:hypothetical protein